MAEHSQQPSDNTPAPQGLDVVAVGKVVREELDRQNKYLEFAQGQIERDRSFYKHLYGFAASFLAFMVAVAGVFSYTSVTQMRTDMKASVDAELVALRLQAKATSSEAQATVKTELANVRTEVQKRIDTEFQSENITNLVANAARERTEKELSGIIRSETSIQVAKGIKDQTPAIKKTVEDQTREAVTTLEPTIKASVDKATQEQVKASVVPIQSQMATYGEFIRVGNLAILARGDDRPAFDYLMQIALGDKPESANQELRKVADSTAGAIIAELKGAAFRTVYNFSEKQTPESLKRFMSSSNKRDRMAALDNYPKDDKSVLPMLIQLIAQDSSIQVVNRAVENFNALTKQSFEFWRTQPIIEWWEKNRTSLQ